MRPLKFGLVRPSSEKWFCYGGPRISLFLALSYLVGFSTFWVPKKSKALQSFKKIGKSWKFWENREKKKTQWHWADFEKWGIFQWVWFFQINPQPSRKKCHFFNFGGVIFSELKIKDFLRGSWKNDRKKFFGKKSKTATRLRGGPRISLMPTYSKHFVFTKVRKR